MLENVSLYPSIFSSISYTHEPVTPGITAQEYYDRRCALAASLPVDSAAVLRASDVKYRSGAVFFPFRQESDFFYLTGFSEPNAVAVIRKTGPDLGDCVFSLLVRPKDPRAEQWQGPWSGVDAARDVFNADEAGDIAAAETLLPNLLRGVRTVYTNPEVDSLLKAGSGSASSAPNFKSVFEMAGASRIIPLAPVVAQQRAFKSKAEVANMRQAGRLSGRALTDAMRRSWTREKDLAAFLDYKFHEDGGDGIAYVPVVAGGQRGSLIHYVLNNATLQEGEMVLVDAGGEYGTYIADITRTWPVNGRFTPAQRDLYEAVLRVQRSSVSLCCQAAGGLSLDQIHRITSDGLKSELTKLGFDFGHGSGSETLSVLFPHHVGHYVGLDVHDTPSYPRHTPLRAGHCVTVEPGIYVPDDIRWPAHFRGLAVRIEDSICVGEGDPLILTTEAVKEVVDIEALRDV